MQITVENNNKKTRNSKTQAERLGWFLAFLADHGEERPLPMMKGRKKE